MFPMSAVSSILACTVIAMPSVSVHRYKVSDSLCVVMYNVFQYCIFFSQHDASVFHTQQSNTCAYRLSRKTLVGNTPLA